MQSSAIGSPAELDYRSLTIALVDIRLTLRKLVRVGHLDPCDAKGIFDTMKGLHFSERTEEIFHGVVASCTSGCKFFPELISGKDFLVNAKMADAKKLLEKIREIDDRSCERSWDFPLTSHFEKQFVVEFCDIPENVARAQ